MIIPSMARTRRYMHGQRRRRSAFKHTEDIAGYPHGNPHREMSETGDAQQKAMYEHDLAESQKTTKKQQKKEYKAAKKEWRKGGKVGDKPEKTWRNRN